MKLSKRLQAVADLLDEGLSVADVGTDHGYIPIYLLQSGKSSKVIALDVHNGPLLRAKEHLIEYGLFEQVDLRLSDGLKGLQPKECEAVVLAGMGGNLIIKILEEGKFLRDDIKQWVLQPQSELFKVRKYLFENGYKIIDEDMVEEEGKFYPMMKVIKGKMPEYHNIEFRYGKCLIDKKHPVLLQYLDKEIRKKEQVLLELETQQTAKERCEKLQADLIEARAAFLRCL